VNGLSFSATSKENIDAWEALGNPGWDWSTFSNAMQKSYKLEETGQGDGPLQLSQPSQEGSEWPQVWKETLNTLGFSDTNDPFSGQICGNLTVPDAIYPSTKRRSFSGNAYLEAAINRPNFTIWTQTPVDRIIFDDGPTCDRFVSITATAVQYTTIDGQIKTVGANREVLLTAGSINSPRILELSGVGDKKLLDTLGIKVVVDNPYVGENLQNHPMCSLNFEVLGDKKGFETMDGLIRQDPDAIADAMTAYESRKSGPFSKSGANYAAHLPYPNLQHSDGAPTLQEVLSIADPKTDSENVTAGFAKAHRSFVDSVLKSPTQASACYLSFSGFTRFNSDGSRASASQLDGNENFFTIVLLLAHPLSRGSVHITSTSAPTSASSIAINPKYLSHPLDIEVLARHLQYAETIMATEPLASHVKPGGKRNPTTSQTGSFKDIQEAKKYARETAVGAAHYTGTCSMMPRELGGVVDSDLRLYGCRNLRVCDASIMPITPRTNPQATVYGIAERAAEIIRSTL
jgi:choline dehydrogenase-like flavoprotein